MDQEPNLIKVSSDTNMARLCDTIYKSIMDKEDILIRGFGEFAIYQMTKALARCRNRLIAKNMYMRWYSNWETVKGEKDGKKLSALTTIVEYGDEVVQDAGA